MGRYENASVYYESALKIDPGDFDSWLGKGYTESPNQTGYKVVVDPGNGQVLYTSEGNALGTFCHGGPRMFGHGGPRMFGHGGPRMFHDGAKWMGNGFKGFGGSGNERGPGPNQTKYAQ